ncbi:MAG: NAD-dependent malic enzyme [candidate division TA06 bacterium ADurb.Bin417]|uniref:NAD-dependent malic enzyme n=1 Tax=candidate division TA06 bacterium ADurb.Bin417 TaxID=1852828 RepID=A0A1V5MLB8_UNCT6|nr:MAG: NAD-dependent malic enzyme [candidate division TA06 bacterium ADurb.Bin417]
MDYFRESLELHRASRGKIELRSRVPLRDKRDLSLAYTPGVAAACQEIHRDPARVYDYTSRGNLVAIVSDGSAVLGLGNIGPEAALPVMEGKAILFKEFGGVDAFPIVLASQDTEEIIRTVVMLAPSFGGINLEDISAPRCFRIEAALKEKLDIPVFHDDQHGTAIVVYAALINALKIASKRMDSLRVVISGAGAAGIAVARILMDVGVPDIIICDRRGAIYEGRKGDVDNEAKLEMARISNPGKRKGTLTEVLEGADVFIGVSVPGLLTGEAVRRMGARPIIFALANPIPEIDPEEARQAGALVVATGRSDFPNQVNNLLAFPGIFKGAFQARAKKITEGMKQAAGLAIASLVTPPELTPECIIPSPLDRRVAPVVAEAVQKAYQTAEKP